jgi:hypothetical protein
MRQMRMERLTCQHAILCQEVRESDAAKPAACAAEKGTPIQER